MSQTFLFPPVRVTLTKRRVYWMRFFARPLGVFFFSCGSTCRKILASSSDILASQSLSSFLPVSSWNQCPSMPSQETSYWHASSKKSLPTPVSTLQSNEISESSYLWCLRLDLSGTCEGSVDFSH